MSCILYTDRNRHIFLEYKQGVKYNHLITMYTGSIKTHRIKPRDIRRLGLVVMKDLTPEHFVEVCLKSKLDKTPRALLVLNAMAGKLEIPDENEEPNRVNRRASNNPLMVPLGDIIAAKPWDAQRVRKYLRKAGKRPGTRWEWSKEEVPAIIAYLESLGEVLNKP